MSSQNLVVAFSAYKNFEEFKEEVVSTVGTFRKLFDIETFTRVGLRYVNEIMLPTQEPESLGRYVRPFFVLDCLPVNSMRQFAMQFTAGVGKHMVTARTALLSGALRTYVLDIDAHTETVTDAARIPELLEDFHDIGDPPRESQSSNAAQPARSCMTRV